MRPIVAVWALVLIAGSVYGQALPTPRWSYTVVAQYPHETSAFTEGLLVHGDELFESTGIYGRSGLFISDIHSGKLHRSSQLDPGEFGEGLALAGHRLYQLTWREGICHVYDLDLRLLKNFQYSGEGWGLTFDGHALIRSDGTPTLHFHDPSDFHEVRSLMVRDAGRPVGLLNELEWVGGQLFANVWTTDRIAVIDPATGTVTGWLDLGILKQGFVPPSDWNPRDDVLNGIAYDPRTGHLLVTGKRWPTIFEIAVSPGAAH